MGKNDLQQDELFQRPNEVNAAALELQAPHGLLQKGKVDSQQDELFQSLKEENTAALELQAPCQTGDASLYLPENLHRLFNLGNNFSKIESKSSPKLQKLQQEHLNFGT